MATVTDGFHLVVDALKLNGLDIEGHKSKAATLETENGNVKKQLEDANKQIESFKGMKIEEIVPSGVIMTYQGYRFRVPVGNR